MLFSQSVNFDEFPASSVSKSIQKFIISSFHVASKDDGHKRNR